MFSFFDVEQISSCECSKFKLRPDLKFLHVYIFQNQAANYRLGLFLLAVELYFEIRWCFWQPAQGSPEFWHQRHWLIHPGCLRLAQVSFWRVSWKHFT